MRKIFLFSIAIIVITSCGQKKEAENQEGSKTPLPNLLPQLQNHITAHGGLEQWKSFGTLTFDRVSGDNIVKHTIDLNNRNELLSKDSTYTVGYLGDKSWVLPDSSAFMNVRFYKNLHFYFFALPFVVADEGAIHEYLGKKTFNGEIFDLVKVSYGENVGDAPDDQYILYINSETKLLNMINYSVTYFDKSRGERYSALVYNGWQKVNGLLVPTSFSGYKWANDTLGDLRYQAAFENVQFNAERPDAGLFEIPHNAYAE